MKNRHRMSLLILMFFMAASVLLAPWAMGAGEPPGEQPDKPVEGEEVKAPPDAEEKGEEKEDKPETVAVNLNNASIEQVIKFLRDKTGKVIFKSDKANAKITIASPGPVSPEKAVDLIREALRLQNVIMLEHNGLLYLLTEEDLANMPVKTVEGDQEVPPTGMVRRVVNIEFADVSEIKDLVEPLLSKESKMVADPRTKKVIITAPAHAVLNLESVIKQLDVLQIDETQLKVFKLEHAVADEIAPLLETLLEDSGGGAGQPGRGGRPSPHPGRSGSGQETGPGVTVVAYPALNWIVVRAPEKKLEVAAELIEQIDKEKPPELDIHVIPLENADAENLSRELGGLFRERRRTEDPRDRVEIGADTRANALIVRASTENFKLIQEIIQSLDTEDSRQTETRSFPLSFADAVDVAEQLNQLYSEMQERYYYYSYRSRSRDRSRTRFVPERRTNTLIVIAEPSEFKQIEQLIEELDQPISEDELAPRIFRIKNIDAKELTDVLNETFGIADRPRTGRYSFYSPFSRYRSGTDEGEVGRLYGKIRFIHEPTTNSVIVVTNNKANFPIIESLIKDLDEPTLELANTLVYELEHADATQLANELNSLFAPLGARMPGQRGGQDDENEGPEPYLSWLFGSSRREREERPISNLIGKVRVVPDNRVNALIITTQVQYFEVIRKLIEELDIESPKVLMEVQLVEVTRSSESRVGTRFGSSTSIFQDSDFNEALLGAFGVEWEEVTTDTRLTANMDVSALIQLLQREFDARTLSQPSLVVNNNQEADIFVGSEVPRLTDSITEPGTIARRDSFEYTEIGTQLTIKPHINKEDKVVTSVQIEASERRPGEVLFGGEVYDKRKYNTELAVDSGQTMVIGGILTEDESEVVHKVPLLGDIPLLGGLFRKTDTEVTTRELIAFITPTVLRQRTDDESVTKDQREKLEEMRKWKSELRKKHSIEE